PPHRMSYLDSLFRDISKAFSPELPAGLGSMDQHLDFILPHVRPFGEDLREPKYWQNMRWMEVRDEEGFHEAILHIFHTGGEYMLVLDGNIVKGSWRQLGQSNSLIIEINGRSELFELQFLNGVFLILSKHGDQVRKGFRKYFVLANERAARMDWRNLMELLFNTYRERSISVGAWVFFLILLAVIIYLSIR
ncbi:MAG TPA: hypothetical protein PK971_09335, partial [Saprospiraceae bacterium]|nr:hypothetical protein [Saprospiraceae bacterium]